MTHYCPHLYDIYKCNDTCVELKQKFSFKSSSNFTRFIECYHKNHNNLSANYEISLSPSI